MAKQSTRIEVRYVPIETLTAFSGNARKHPDKQIRELADAIKRLGWGPPLIARNNVLAAGHARLAAAKLLGMREVPVIDRSDWTEAEMRAFVIADNKLAEGSEWDMEILNSELAAIAQTDPDLAGLTTFDLGKLARVATKKAEETLVAKGDAELPGVADLKPFVVFKSDLPWDIPEMRSDMLGDLPSKDIRPWIGSKTDESTATADTWWLWIYGGGEVPPARLRGRVMTAFYEDDAAFESTWSDTPGATTKMLNAGITTTIATNFSLWSDLPRVERLWNTYRNRYIARYWQEAGIRVIPDVSISIASDFDFCTVGIPRDLPALSIQGQTVTKVADKIELIDGMRRVIDQLTPKRILCYSGTDTDEVIEAIGCASITTYVSSRTQDVRAYFKKKKGIASES